MLPAERERIKRMIADLRKIVRTEKQVPFDQAPVYPDQKPETVPISAEERSETMDKIAKLQSIEINRGVNKAIVEKDETTSKEAIKKAALIKELSNIKDVAPPGTDLPLFSVGEDPDFKLYDEYADLFKQIKGVSKADAKTVDDVLRRATGGFPPTSTQVKKLNRVSQVLRDLELKLATDDLRQLAKKMNVKPLRIFSVDELVNAKPRLGSYIINLDDSSGPGTHWVALYSGKNQEYTVYFDPFGVDADARIIAFMKQFKKQPIGLTLQAQDLKASSCGYWCLYFLHSMTNGESPAEFLSELDSRDQKQNEKHLREVFR